MGCYQVGGQSGRNIRDNTYVIYAICHDARLANKPVDITLYDIEQCFDSLWLPATINDLYTNGTTNRNLNSIFGGNKVAAVGIRNKNGLVDDSKRMKIYNTVMQGSVLGPIICSNQISKFPIEAKNRGNANFFMDIVPVPPLCMADDIVSITVCDGTSNIRMDFHCDAFAMRKKISYKPTKCCSVHIKKTECLTTHKVKESEIPLERDVKYLADWISGHKDTLFLKRLDRASS